MFSHVPSFFVHCRGHGPSLLPYGLQLNSFALKISLSALRFFASAHVQLYSKRGLPYYARWAFDESLFWAHLKLKLWRSKDLHGLYPLKKFGVNVNIVALDFQAAQVSKSILFLLFLVCLFLVHSPMVDLIRMSANTCDTERTP